MSADIIKPGGGENGNGNGMEWRESRTTKPEGPGDLAWGGEKILTIRRGYTLGPNFKLRIQGVDELTTNTYMSLCLSLSLYIHMRLSLKVELCHLNK